MEDCGAFEGIKDFAQIIVRFEKYGIFGVGEEEVLKVIKHYTEITNDIQLGILYWNKGTVSTYFLIYIYLASWRFTVLFSFFALLRN